MRLIVQQVWYGVGRYRVIYGVDSACSLRVPPAAKSLYASDPEHTCATCRRLRGPALNRCHNYMCFFGKYGSSEPPSRSERAAGEREFHMPAQRFFWAILGQHGPFPRDEKWYIRR